MCGARPRAGGRIRTSQERFRTLHGENARAAGLLGETLIREMDDARAALERGDVM